MQHNELKFEQGLTIQELKERYNLSIVLPGASLEIDTDTDRCSGI